MARLVMFQQGDGPAPDTQCSLKQTDDGNISMTARGAGGAKQRWACGGGWNSDALVTGNYRVVLEDGSVVPIVGVTGVVRMHDMRATAQNMSLSKDQEQQNDVDFRNKKAKKIERDRQTYGNTYAQSSAKPSRMNDDEARVKLAGQKREREADVRRGIEGASEDELAKQAGPKPPQNSASKKSRK